eukprot:1000059_1
MSNKPWGRLIPSASNDSVFPNHIELREPKVSIGSIAPNDIVIDHPLLSRKHCNLRHITGTHWCDPIVMEDTSTNGTWLMSRGEFGNETRSKVSKTTAPIKHGQEMVLIPQSKKRNTNRLSYFLYLENPHEFQAYKIFQFRRDVSKLNDDEFKSFFKDISQMYDQRELLEESLFHLLQYQSKHNRYDHCDNMNQAIKDIMDNRRNLPQQKPLCTFDGLPSSLVSECASYLDLESFTSFQRCNRHTLIASWSSTNSITDLYKFDYDKYKHNYGNTNKMVINRQINTMNRFKHIQHVTLSIPDIVEMENDYACCLAIFSNLKSFTLAGGAYGVMGDMHFICQALGHLKCDHLILSNHFMIYADPSKKMRALQDYMLIRNLCQIQQLSLNYRIYSSDRMGFIQAFSQLKGLLLPNCNRYYIFGCLVLIGHQLQSLHIGINASFIDRDWIDSRFTFEDNRITCWGSSCDLVGLQELCVNDCSLRTIQLIMHTAVNVKRLHLRWKHAVKMLDTISNLKRLEYVSILINSSLSEEEEIVVIDSVIALCMKDKSKLKLRLTLPTISESFKLRLNASIGKQCVLFDSNRNCVSINLCEYERWSSYCDHCDPFT